jgi:hypothetical protein
LPLLYHQRLARLNLISWDLKTALIKKALGSSLEPFNIASLAGSYKAPLLTIFHKIIMFIQKSISILLLSLVSAHCGQLVDPKKSRATNGDKIKYGKHGFKTIGQSSTDSGIPLGDFLAPDDYVGLNEEESYKKMLADGLSVKDLFKQVVTNDVVKHYDPPGNGGFTAETCGYYDPEFEIEIDEDTNPQTSTTGNNHAGPAEVWMDDVMTHHISNLMYQQPEVLSRNVYNCNKDSCFYK